MQFVIERDVPPPTKEYWHSNDAGDRKGWSYIFEALTAWFCQSNRFRKELDAIIKIDEISIKLVGENIRYFSPSLRSIASLIDKAFQTGQKLLLNSSKESTPGIIVSKIDADDRYKKPWYYYEFNCIGERLPINKGTIFSSMKSDSKPIKVPGNTLEQAIIWTLYGV